MKIYQQIIGLVTLIATVILILVAHDNHTEFPKLAALLYGLTLPLAIFYTYVFTKVAQQELEQFQSALAEDRRNHRYNCSESTPFDQKLNKFKSLYFLLEQIWNVALYAVTMFIFIIDIPDLWAYGIFAAELALFIAKTYFERQTRSLLVGQHAWLVAHSKITN